MKIGILTHYYNSLNYGGMLQSYALATYLVSKGYDAQQICYAFSSEPFSEQKPIACEVTQQREKLPLLFHFIKRAYGSAHYRLVDRPAEQYYEAYKKRELKQRAVSFSEFQNLVPHSERLYDFDNVFEAVPLYDCLITGSDQVWNFKWFNPAFFLDFSDHSIKKIAYAVSAGKSTFSEEEKDYLTKTLSDFDAISVREDDLIPALGALNSTNHIMQAVDPTLLISIENWDKIASPKLVPKKYLFCYFLHNNKLLKRLAIKFAHKHHLKLVTIPFSGIEYNYEDVHFGNYRFDGAGPADFISLIKYAEYVFTDSFHASVFSILYGREFVVFPRKNATTMGSRLETLTEMFNCKERFCRVNEEDWERYVESLTPLDVQRKTTLFEFRKRNSELFLKTALQEIGD